MVENKDRYLEGRYYYDEWDKALRARGHVKQQRVLYRQRDDYNESLGAFDWELPEDLHSDMFVGDFATWWLRNKPKPDGPLFMQVGFPGPHPPYDPSPRFSQAYMDKELPLQEVTEDELAGQPPPFHEMRVHNSEVDHDSVMHLLDPTPEQRHRQRAYYMANVSMIDEKVGELLAALDEQGYLENAVVIFTSDHGDCLGDHGHSQKWTMYDIITRVPTIVWAPKRFAGGRSLDQLCSLFDLGPTILELAGLETSEDFEAESLLPALEGKGLARAGKQFLPSIAGTAHCPPNTCRWRVPKIGNWSTLSVNHSASCSIWLMIRRKSTTCGMTLPMQPGRKSFSRFF